MSGEYEAGWEPIDSSYQDVSHDGKWGKNDDAFFK